MANLTFKQWVNRLYGRIANLKNDLVKTDDKLLVNKGTYDLYPYQSDRSKVLRQTGYLVINASDITSTSVITAAGSGNKLVLTNIMPQGVDNSQPVATVIGVSSNGSYRVVRAGSYWAQNLTIGLSNGEALHICNNDFTTVDQFKALCPIYIQYKLATSYVEPVIENQPLLTLDQQGSQWLRREWEKGLNLWQGFEYLNLNSADGSITPSASNLSSNYIPVKPNTTYTYDNYPTSVNNIVAYYTSSKTYIERTSGGAYGTRTFTTPSNCYYVAIGMVGSLTTAQITEALTHNVMLNEGSIAKPYQEYNGAIVREKDLEHLYRHTVFLTGAELSHRRVGFVMYSTQATAYTHTSEIPKGKYPNIGYYSFGYGGSTRYIAPLYVEIYDNGEYYFELIEYPDSDDVGGYGETLCSVTDTVEQIF